jgi:nickel-dependent lactate racemase
MSDDANTQSYQLTFGTDQSIEFSLPPERVVWQHYAPEAVADPAAAVQEALSAPIDFPPLSQAVIPDDVVVIAAEIDTPGLQIIVAEVWSILADRGVEPDHLVIVQAAGGVDPRLKMPDEVRDKVTWLQHNPDNKSGLAYLASTTGGERIQLARAITDADVVVTVGRIGFDPLLGFRGTNSAFYPELSTTEAIAKTRGQGHFELEPEDSRPLRQIVDEVGWLLGTQFTIQTIPALRNGIAITLAGAFETVLRRGKEYVSRELLVTPDERPELVVVAVSDDAGGHGWTQVAAAIATGRRLVARDGKILVLSQINEDVAEGLQILKLVESPEDAIKPLRLESPTDLIAATQIAGAVQWADVYLLSDVDADLVDDLFMFPLGDIDEARRLIGNAEGTVAIIEDAHNVHGRIAD